MRNLRWVVPISRQYSILFSCDFVDVLYGKGLTPVEVIEQFHNLPHFFLCLDHPMRFYDFCEGHLTDSYHTSPASIADKGSLDIMVKLRKASAIGQPWSLAEALEEKRILLL